MKAVRSEKQESNSNIFFLDSIRGLAAIYVLIGHARWLLWEGYQAFKSHPQNYSYFGKIILYILSIFRYGHEAVLVFFILSGFVIHHRNSLRLRLDKKYAINYKIYLFKRITRIYPPLLFSIALTFTLDSIGINNNYSIYFHNTVNSQINQNIQIHLGYDTLIGNIFMLQTIYVPTWGSNGPLWSLMYEWWFYMLYPLLFLLNRKSPNLSTLVVISFTLFCWLVPYFTPLKLITAVGSYWLCWTLGMILADIFSNRLTISFAQFIALTIVFSIYYFFKPYLNSDVEADTLLSIGFTGIMAIFFHMHEKRQIFIHYLSKLRKLSDFSYTLYVIHFPILVFINGIALSNTRNFPQSFNYLAVGIGVSVVVSYLLHFGLESYFTKKQIK